MINKNSLILVYFLFFSIFIFSQNLALKNKENDSLFIALKAKPNNINKVRDLINLYKKTAKEKQINNDIINEALKISEKIYYLDGIAECYDRKGYYARKQFDYSNSLTFHKRALNYLNKTTDTLLKIKCLNNLGVTYHKLNLEKESFEYYFKALKLAEKFKHNRSITIALSGIGNVFIDTKEYDKALYYFKRVYALDKKEKRIKGQEYSLSNLGEVFLYKKEYDSAFYYLNKALTLTKVNHHKSSEAIRYNLLGLLFQRKGDYKKSTSYYKEAIPLFTSSNNVRYLSNTLINIGKNQLYTGKQKEAFENISLGLKNAKAIKSKENIALGYSALVDYYTKVKNYKKALNAFKTATSFQDSIVNEASQKSIISTQIEYDTAKKDQKIKQLAVDNKTSQEQAKTNFRRVIYISIFSVLVIAGLAILLFLYRRNSDLELENKNSELQNYIHQIKEMKENVNKNTSINIKKVTEKFNEFGLSKRESEVFNFISKGFSNDEIAEKMFVSKNTVKTHIKNIYIKLDVKNRIQAIKKITDV
jgi:ATP/maltotriose-dependent transcriptional regulator MalT